jgi:hypothetical protein
MREHAAGFALAIVPSIFVWQEKQKELRQQPNINAKYT